LTFKFREKKSATFGFEKSGRFKNGRINPPNKSAKIITISPQEIPKKKSETTLKYQEIPVIFRKYYSIGNIRKYYEIPGNTRSKT
jgi:hypothetical protein